MGSNELDPRDRGVNKRGEGTHILDLAKTVEEVDAIARFETLLEIVTTESDFRAISDSPFNDFRNSSSSTQIEVPQDPSITQVIESNS